MRRTVLAIGFLGMAAALAGCGGSTPSGAPATTGTATRPAAPPATGTIGTSSRAAGLTLRIYLLRSGRVTPVARHVPQTQAVARAAVEQLLAGPTPAERARGLDSAIPAGSRLAHLTIADGRATVDLGATFAQATGVEPRLAQLVFTLTQFPSVKSVVLELGGRQIGSPTTRADYEQLTPPILVESPLPGEDATTPLRVTGTANVFEATFQLQVQTGAGSVVATKTVTASSGAPERGTFDASVPVDATAGPITLVAYDDNQATGQREHLVVVPLQLVR
jgi:germination protein M